MRVVGCVPYVNAYPLLWGLEPQIAIVRDEPSKLPALLESGHADAILVSSIEALRNPGRVAVRGVGIGSDGPSQSVRLFSKVPFDQIETLALDRASMTSNALARIVLSETFGAEPLCEAQPPDLTAMLADHDACVLIGDNGMAATGRDLYPLDLGTAWRDLTGLPFVWALWVGGIGLDTALADRLRAAHTEGREHVEELAEQAESARPMGDGVWLRYLRETMRYALDDRFEEGLASFGELCMKHGLIDGVHPIVWA